MTDAARHVRAVALQAALDEVGVTEQPIGSHDGPRVREYQAATGVYRAAWCGSFVAWAYGQAGVTFDGVAMELVAAIVDAARDGRGGLSVVAPPEAGPGDLACFDWFATGTPIHVGLLVSAIGPDGTFESVEGNTGEVALDPDGGRVALRTRRASGVLAFVRVTPGG